MEQAACGLAIFDMDFTISEDYLYECLFQTMDSKEYKDRLDYFFSKQKKWPTVLGEVMAAYPPDRNRIDTWMHQTKVVDGIDKVLEYLHAKGYELVLISGGNSHLATKFLEAKGFRHYFSHVIAPELEYHSEGYRYDTSITSCHLEDVCHHGFCKGVALSDHNKETPDRKILYFGDGINDLCAMHHINDGLAFIRRGKYLHKQLYSYPTVFDHIIRCYKIFWSDGHEALTLLRQHFG